MQTAAILLGLAALGGLTMAVIRLRGMPRPPTWMAAGHGAIAVAGLAFLAFSVLQQPTTTLPQISLGILVLAALGGLILFAGFHLAQKPLPIPLVIAHGLIAASGYVVLLLSLR